MLNTVSLPQTVIGVIMSALASVGEDYQIAELDEL
jgi:hypothetical protein